MKAEPIQWVRRFWRLSLAVLCILPQPVNCADLPAGKVVWWGLDVIRRTDYFGQTNGVIESVSGILSKAVAVAARHGTALVLKDNGTVFAFGHNFYGGNDVPTGLSNVISIAVEGNSCWAIRRDGTLARWGNHEDDSIIVAGLRNIKAVAWTGYIGNLALKNDGAVLGFRFDSGRMPTDPMPERAILPVKVRGQVLSNVAALASMKSTPLLLMKDGTVLTLGFQTPGAPTAEPVASFIDERTLVIDLGGESRKTPYEYTSAEPVTVGGTILSNVMELDSGGFHALALKSNGTVVAWGDNSYGEASVPPGLSNVIMIAASSSLSLALKRDGTVVAWGNNHYGQTSVPPGLSNVIAIAAGGDFSLAITTGAIPSSVYIQSRGR